MNQKSNIFEELGRMKNLIHTKAGTVISEQVNIGADVGTIVRELDNLNSDEAKIVNIIKNYKDKASFKNFIDQYKTISGKDFAVDVLRAITPTNDKVEWNDLKTHLSSLGIALTYEVRDPRKGGSYAIFGGIGTPSAVTSVVRTPEAIKNINATFCSIKDGKIGAGAFKGQPWESYKGKYSVTPAEEESAKKSCKSPSGRVSTGGTSGRANVISKYSKELQTSLGMTPTGQLTDIDLDSILKKLEGGEIDKEVTSSTQSIPTDASGQPDIDKIIASL